MQLPSGVLADTVGPRRLFTAGSVVAGAGSILFALAPGVGMLLAGRALVGFGVAVAFISVLKLIASWFREREFGTYLGLLMFVGNLGGMLAAYPLAWVTQFVSWRQVFVAAGVISLVLALATWTWVRDDPRHAGLEPPDGSSASRSAARADAQWWDGLALVARNPQTWACFVVHLGVVGSFLAFSGLWAVPFLGEGLGMSRAFATAHATLMIFGFALGSLFIGTASDRMGRRLPLLHASLVLYLLCWLPWLAGWHPPLAISFAVFFCMGLGMGGMALTWACAKELNPPAFAATAASLVNTGGFLGTALFQPLVGWVIDRSAGGAHAARSLDDYRMGLAVLAAFALLGVGAAFFTRETRCRNVYAELRR